MRGFDGGFCRNIGMAISWSASSLLLIITLLGACYTTHVRSNPLILNGKTNYILENRTISNSNGDCIQLIQCKNLVIRNVDIGPCGGHGVKISGGSGITLSYLTINHTPGGNGISAESVTNLRILRNSFSNHQSGVYILSSTQVKIEGNRFLNSQGPSPRGQFIQLDKVTGSGNRILCNSGVNIGGQSSPEDAINIYKSSGIQSDPLMIAGNKINGGGPSDSGGGIMLGDDGGSYITAMYNVLVNPGQHGIGIASGNNIKLLNNQVYAIQQPFTNVGIYVWNQYSSPCFSITVANNRVNYKNSDGISNPFWDGSNCGTIQVNNNTWSASLDQRIINQPINYCLGIGYNP